ncbi:MAG: hypothetical protein KF847_12010 [Pirellulales bacterium]|nr:hypothetical protein [Pirellulales bacterium]
MSSAPQGGSSASSALGGPTLAEFFRDCYMPEHLSRPDQRHTIAFYEVQIRHLAAFAARQGLAPLRLADVTGPLVKGAMNDLVARGRSLATANKIQRAAAALVREAWQLELTGAPLRCRPLRTPQRAPRAWSTDELGALLAAAERLRGFVGGVRADVWMPALLWFLWRIGSRLRSRPARAILAQSSRNRGRRHAPPGRAHWTENPCVGGSIPPLSTFSLSFRPRSAARQRPRRGELLGRV